MSRVFTLVMWEHCNESVVYAYRRDVRELKGKGEMNVERCWSGAMVGGLDTYRL